jgi:hypothetical protein
MTIQATNATITAMTIQATAVEDMGMGLLERRVAGSDYYQGVLRRPRRCMGRTGRMEAAPARTTTVRERVLRQFVALVGAASMRAQ